MPDMFLYPTVSAYYAHGVYGYRTSIVWGLTVFFTIMYKLKTNFTRLRFVHQFICLHFYVSKNYVRVIMRSLKKKDCVLCIHNLGKAKINI